MNSKKTYAKANFQKKITNKIEEGGFDPPVLGRYYMNAPQCTIEPMVRYTSGYVPHRL